MINFMLCINHAYFITNLKIGGKNTIDIRSDLPTKGNDAGKDRNTDDVKGRWPKEPNTREGEWNPGTHEKSSL